MFKLRVGSVIVIVITVCGLSPSTVISGTVLFRSDRREEISNRSEQVELKSGAASCSIVLQRHVYTAGEPIVAKLQITNRTPETVQVNLGFDREGAFLFQIKRPNGSIFSPPQTPTRSGLSQLPTFAIKPRAIYLQYLILNHWDSFMSPGLYEVSVRLDESIVGSNCFAEMTPLFLEIQPLNILRLGEASEELVDRIKKASNYAIASDAARMLIAIKNPVVVPYLKKAHQANPRVDDILIEGLESIANREAVEVLISILEESDKKSSSFSQAWSALRRVERKTGNPETTQLIRNVLREQTP